MTDAKTGAQEGNRTLDLFLTKEIGHLQRTLVVLSHFPFLKRKGVRNGKQDTGNDQ